MKKIGYDEALAAESKASEAIFNAWYNEKDQKKIFETVVDSISAAFLVEGYPAELGAKMDEWKSKAKQLGIGEKTLKKFADFAAWKTGWEKGKQHYESVWND